MPRADYVDPVTANVRQNAYPSTTLCRCNHPRSRHTHQAAHNGIPGAITTCHDCFCVYFAPPTDPDTTDPEGDA